jgi:hypothetical protein
VLPLRVVDRRGGKWRNDAGGGALALKTRNCSNRKINGRNERGANEGKPEQKKKKRKERTAKQMAQDASGRVICVLPQKLLTRKSHKYSKK